MRQHVAASGYGRWSNHASTSARSRTAVPPRPVSDSRAANARLRARSRSFPLPTSACASLNFRPARHCGSRSSLLVDRQGAVERFDSARVVARGEAQLSEEEERQRMDQAILVEVGLAGNGKEAV